MTLSLGRGLGIAPMTAELLLIVDQVAVAVTDSEGGIFCPAHGKIEKILENSEYILDVNTCLY